MALSNIPSCHVFNQVFIFFLLLLPNAMSISFEFPSFSTNNINLTLQGDAFTNPDGLQLTKDTRGSPSAEVLVVPYIMNEFTFETIAQGSLNLQTSSLTSPSSLHLLIRRLLMGSLSSSHHLILISLTIQLAGFLGCLVMNPLSTAPKIKLLLLSLTLTETHGIQVIIM